jgi:predicted MFS family arabinose efflux permease
MTETSRDPPTTSDPATLIIGAIAAQVIGGLITQMSPLVIAGLIDGLWLSESEAGLVASIEFLVLAAAAIVIAPILPRISCRSTALAGVALTLMAGSASIFSTSWPSFAALRGLAGLGEGAIYAVSLAVVASRCANPDRVYGYFQLVWASGSVALFWIGGELTAAFAYRGILGLIAAVTLALAPLLFFLPKTPTNNAAGGAADAARGSRVLGVMTLAAIVLYVAVSAAVYTFSAPLGERAGLDTRQVGYALTVGSLAGLAGAGAATVFNVRWGRAIPISGFCVAFSLAMLVLCLSHNPIAYLVALVGSFIVFYFSMPYLFGLAAALDRPGRWAAAAGSAYLCGFAAGPAVAGAVTGAGGYASLAAVSVSITVVVWGLAMFINRRLTKTPGPRSLAADGWDGRGQEVPERLE